MEKALEYIRQYRMVEAGDRVIAGVSGGADSICLLFVLCKLREQVDFSLETVHVEHGIRGEESLEDARFTEELCKRIHVPFHLCTVNVPKRAKQEKLTMEEAARKCRYEAFRKVCGGEQKAKIAVAHNQDDQAETILWNLVRGSGLRGLGGMKPVSGNIIRPLLGVSRREIEAWLGELGQSFRIDSTNLEDAYTRNKLRHQILPALETGLNIKAKEHIADVGERVRKAEHYIEKQAMAAAEHISEMKSGEIWVKREPFLQFDEILQEYMIRSWIHQLEMGLKDVSAIHIEELKKLAAGPSGKVTRLPMRKEGRCTQEYLVLGNRKEKSEQTEPVILQIPGETIWGRYRVITSLESNKNQIIPEKKYTKWLDYDTIKNTIYLRNRHSGDFLVTTPQGGRKKLKKYFIDEKVLQEERNQIPLLAEGSHILWIVGYRISQAYKVTEGTKKVLKVQIEEDYNGR